jgi:hypothetical protein
MAKSLPLIDPHEDVELWHREALGIETPRQRRRDARADRRYAQADDEEGAHSLHFQGSRPNAIVGSTTATANYQEAYTLTFELPEGNWLVVIRPKMEVRCNNTGVTVDVRVQCDGIVLFTDSPIEQVLNAWMSPLRNCAPSDVLDGGSHTVRLDYKSGAAGLTSVARGPSVDVTATREVEN